MAETWRSDGTNRSRVTMLLARFVRSLKMVGEHFSSVPDWHEVPKRGSREGETS